MSEEEMDMRLLGATLAREMLFLDGSLVAWSANRAEDNGTRLEKREGRLP